ncbi:hypothetical protein ACQ4PT_018703 [Festuca glaucescens]
MTVSAQRALWCGFRFNPTPEEAISVYLRRWVVGEPLPDTEGIVYDAEVYNSEPDDLAAAFLPLPKTENRFFFTTCKRQKAGSSYRMLRATSAGSWVAKGKKVIQNKARETIGYHESLRYVYKDKSRESEWLMDEYHLDGSAVVGGDEKETQERVFCRIYPKTGSVTVQQSAAGNNRLLGLGMQESTKTTMAAAAVVQLRRQEPAAPVLRPAITQRQAMMKPPLQRFVTVPTPATTTPQPPKRPMPKAVDPPRPKRMRVSAVQPSLEASPRPTPRHDVVGYDGWKRPSWYSAPALPRAPTAKSRSTVVPPPRPAADQPPPNKMEDDEFTSLLAAELESALQEEDHGFIQQEARNDDDGFVSCSEGDLKVVPQKEHAKIQDEEQCHQHARSLEGLVADERGDDVVAQDIFDGLKDMDDPIDGGDDQDWASIPISEYNDLPW